jgi:hypothetical protein
LFGFKWNLHQGLFGVFISRGIVSHTAFLAFFSGCGRPAEGAFLALALRAFAAGDKSHLV